MIGLAVLIGVIIFVIAFFAVTKVLFSDHWRKYEEFIENHSISIRKLNEINGNYRFFQLESFDAEHTYDNEKMYDIISCEDYLIYQLQFQQKQILSQFDLADKNSVEFERYRDEIKNNCQLGKYDTVPEELKKDKLDLLELQIYNRRILHPRISYSVNITLFLSRINGHIYDKKDESFDKKTIASLIKRLNNKNGSFYLDRDIWDAICRVERGRVSNKMRFAIMKRDGYRCCHCGRKESSYNLLEIDHIIPISKGGKSTYDNLQTLCHNCNAEKGNRF